MSNRLATKAIAQIHSLLRESSNEFYKIVSKANEKETVISQYATEGYYKYHKEIIDWLDALEETLKTAANAK